MNNEGLRNRDGLGLSPCSEEQPINRRETHHLPLQCHLPIILSNTMCVSQWSLAIPRVLQGGSWVDNMIARMLDYTMEALCLGC